MDNLYVNFASSPTDPSFCLPLSPSTSSSSDQSLVRSYRHFLLSLPHWQPQRSCSSRVLLQRCQNAHRAVTNNLPIDFPSSPPSQHSTSATAVWPAQLDCTTVISVVVSANCNGLWAEHLFIVFLISLHLQATCIPGLSSAGLHTRLAVSE